MIDFQALTFDMCRAYVLDNADAFEESEMNKILGWIRSRSFRSLANCSEQFPGVYHSRKRTRVLRQIDAFFKKNARFATPEVLDEEARRAFERAETLCRITNKRLDFYDAHPDRLDDRMQVVISKAQSWIDYVLGEFDPFLESLPRRVRFTAGATSSASRSKSLPYLKANSKINATRQAEPYLRALAKFYGYRIRVKHCYANRVTTVPKNFKTNRTIACEPTGNLPLQLALDEYIKLRLRKKTQLDLSTQVRNQEMAKEGSISGSYATIDLSMASDTLSFNTTALLLPFRWFEYANAVRAPYGRGFDELYKYAKFSSMGNGATFTLETLIFASVVRAVTGSDDFVVYGDDLIVPTEHAEEVLHVLKYLGFIPNQDKSFLSGPFRESCGTDWFQGEDVTPVYVRMKTTMKVEVIHLVNVLAGIASPEGKLQQLLRDLIRGHELPLVPWNENTMSGVWIDSSTAYALKLVNTNTRRFGPWVPAFKGYVPKSPSADVVDSRTLFLWHLDAQSRRKYASSQSASILNHYGWESEEEEVALTRSSVPLLTHKYVRKWVRWVIPTRATPDHLYGWSDYINRR